MPASVESIKPESVLRDLRELWTQLANDNQESGGVLRACAMTLLVVVENEDTAEQGRRVLGGVMHDHPCRAIVLKSSPGAELSARVFAECWMPAGSHTQICAEGIELTADPAHAEGVAQLALPLIVPDLPVVIWFLGGNAWRDQGGKASAAGPLLKLAQKIIVDSSAEQVDTSAAIAAVRALASPSSRVADLAWTRLTGWRESIANAFTCNRSAVIATAEIQYAGPASTPVLYFKRWIEQAVPSALVTLRQIPGAGGIRQVILSGGGDLVTVSLSSASDASAHEDSIEICVGDKCARSPLPSTAEDALMREELSIAGPDPVFDFVLDSMV